VAIVTNRQDISFTFLFVVLCIRVYLTDVPILGWWQSNCENSGISETHIRRVCPSVLVRRMEMEPVS